MNKQKMVLNSFLCTGYVNYKNVQYKVLIHTDYQNVNGNLRKQVIRELQKMNITSGSLSLTKHGKIKDYTIDEYGLNYTLENGGGVNNSFVTVTVLK